MSNNDPDRQKSGGTNSDEQLEWIRDHALNAMTKAERHPIASTNYLQTILDDVGRDYGKIAEHAESAKKKVLQSPKEARYHIRNLISHVDACQELSRPDEEAATKPYADVYGDLNDYVWSEIDATPLHDKLLLEGDTEEQWIVSENPSEVSR